MHHHSSEKGQALILITLAAVGIFAFAALAIDGSMIFSDRRHAQNAADTAATAAALAKIRSQNFITAATIRATSNGYDNNGTTNVVDVYNPPLDGFYAGDSEYIQVKITSHVKTNFARVIGRYEVINHAEAVARAVPGYRTSAFGGNALVALNTDACPAFDYGGGA